MHHIHIEISLLMFVSESDCGDGVMDLVFVIDGSKSLGTVNFERVKRWVNGIVETLSVSKGATQVGLIQYSTKVRTEFTLAQHHSTQAIQQAVTGIQYMGRGSMTGSALRHMFERSFSAAEGARRGVPRVSIVFTDGRSQDDVSVWATKAKQAGIYYVNIHRRFSVPSNLTCVVCVTVCVYKQFMVGFALFGCEKSKLWL